MVETGHPQHVTFNRDHARALFYGLNFPDQPQPADWLPEHLGNEGQYPNSYSLEDFLSRSTSPDAVALILDTASQELGNVSMEGSGIDWLAEALLAQAVNAEKLEDLADLDELAQSLDTIVVKASTEVSVFIQYVNLIEARATENPEPPLLNDKSRHWISEIRKSVELLEQEFTAKLPVAKVNMSAAAQIMADKRQQFTSSSTE